MADKIKKAKRGVRVVIVKKDVHHCHLCDVDIAM